jgi:hypothetical protein
VASALVQAPHVAAGPGKKKRGKKPKLVEPPPVDPFYVHQAVMDSLDNLEWTWESLGPEMKGETGVVWRMAKWYPSYLMRLRGSTKYAVILYHHLGPAAPAS